MMGERGFAYSFDSPLDMRMDATCELTAADIVNTYSVDQLTRVLREYGEERFARRIARAIVARRPLGDQRRTCRRHPRVGAGSRAAPRGAPGQAHLPSASNRSQ